MAKAILVELEFFSTFSINFPSQTASPSPLPIPMPSTLIGALAASYFRYYKGSEVIVKGKKLYSASVKLLWDKGVLYATGGYEYPSAITFQDLTRVIISPYQRRGELQFNAVGFGRTISRSTFIALYLVSDSSAEILGKVAWGITSIGNKESLVEVKDVNIEDIKPENIMAEAPNAVDTMFYVDADVVNCNSILVSGWPLEDQVYTSRENRSVKQWCVPYDSGLYGGYMTVNPIKGKADVIKIKRKDKYEAVVIPKGIIQK